MPRAIDADGAGRSHLPGERIGRGKVRHTRFLSNVWVSVCNEADPKELCKDGGWQGLMTGDGTPFANQGECVAYAARGGLPNGLIALDVVWTVSPAGGSFSGQVIGIGLQPGADVIATYEYLRDPGNVQTSPLGSVGPDDTFAFFVGITSCDLMSYIVISTLDRNGNPIATDDPILC